mmetsp:Transcript_2581/g.3762  ORF Transcript_2581/g.3762 Transcript_2581/m.3762 type:complete len:661 (-) Transcript_2581:103-2085(-)
MPLQRAGKLSSILNFIVLFFCGDYYAQVSLSYSPQFTTARRVSPADKVVGCPIRSRIALWRELDHDSGTSNANNGNNGETRDEYNDFAANFHKILQSEEDPPITTATTVENKKDETIVEKSRSSYHQKLIDASNYYRRDPRDDLTVPMDEVTILKLLGTRVLARRRKDFKEADRVDRELRNMHGVYAYDKDRIWTTQKIPPGSFLRRKARQAEVARKKQFGSAPYTQVGDEIDTIICPFTVDEIYSLLSRRLQCRMEGKFEVADAIKFELIVNGVRFSDGLRQWRADGDNQFDKNEKKNARFAEKYSQHKLSPDLQVDSLKYRVKRLIQERAEARVRRDFHLVDSITLELYRTYRVAVEDQGRTWSVGSSAFGTDIDWEPPSVGKATAPSQPRSSSTTKLLPLLFAGDVEENKIAPSYSQSEHSLRLEDESLLPRVEHLIQERLQLKEERTNFGADAIQKELWVTYNVGLNDRLRQWSVGGIFESPDTRQNRRRSTGGSSGGAPRWTKLLYSHRLTGNGNNNPLLPETVTYIENLIRYFQTALKNNNGVLADRIRERLLDTHGVTLNDDTMEWYVDTGYESGNAETGESNKAVVYSPKGSITGISARGIANIQSLVNRRYKEKYNKGNPIIANTVEIALWKKHRVVIDDDSQVWYVEQDE